LGLAIYQLLEISFRFLTHSVLQFQV